MSDNPLHTVYAESTVDIAIQEIIMNNCNLTTLPKQLFQGNLVKNLQGLHIMDNQQPLELDNFLMLGADFKELRLSNSGITEVNFLKGTSAEMLYLDGNPLGASSGDVMVYMRSAVQIYLNNTGMEVMNFQGAPPGLMTLSLADNEIASVSDHDVIHLRSVTSLNLRNNRIDDITANFSHFLPGLKFLDLAGNLLTDFTPDWVVGRNLTYLHLENNLIQSISEGQCHIL